MAQTENFEELAAVLDAHPDYKVLRRMPSNVVDIVAARGGEHLRIAIVDVETTGLQFGRDKIIELGAIVVEVDPETFRCTGVVDAYQGFEDLGCPIPAETTAINGITDDMVAGQRLDDQRLAAMFAGVDLVIAHNAGGLLTRTTRDWYTPLRSGGSKARRSCCRGLRTTSSGIV